jgi:hypothetical protein
MSGFAQLELLCPKFLSGLIDTLTKGDIKIHSEGHLGRERSVKCCAQDAAVIGNVVIWKFPSGYRGLRGDVEAALAGAQV